MKRIVTILCTAALLFSLLLPASAEGLTFTATDAAGEVGKEVTVNIEMSGNTGVAGVKLSVAYDPSLTLTKAVKGTALTGLDFTAGGDMTANPYVLLWDGMDADSSNGTIAVLTFVPVKSGHFEVSLSAVQSDIFDNDLNDVGAAFVKATVSAAGEDGGASPVIPVEPKPEETKPEETKPEPAAPAFIDVAETDWFAPYVAYVVEKGLMQGTGATTFSPKSTMTRAMLMTVIARMEGQDISGADWAEKATNWAKENGISDGSNPGGEITREQLAKMLYNYLQKKGGGFTGTWAQKLDFTDAGDVSDWALEAITWMTMNGVITGMGGGKLAPQASATRAQVAAMLQRFTELEK